MDYEITIGLETHVQLRTASKMWCGCSTAFGAPANAQTCPVCLGLPGVLPVANAEAIRKTIVTGLMLGARIAATSKFDRKNYFYPDMPKNYQISQYDMPLCVGGAVELEMGLIDAKSWGQRKRIGITRVHLEEDVGKLNHYDNQSGVDFNRAGVPLMEIVSEPDIASADEAFAYLETLKEALIAVGVSDCDMEKGQVRCDVNVSVRPRGQKEYGAKIEIKNMNTFSGARRALEYEVKRQIASVSRGEKLVQETRRWDDVAGATESMRTKEYAHDYRYFPDPDLLPIQTDESWLEKLRSELPESPGARRKRLAEKYNLSEQDAGILGGDVVLADYFEETAKTAKTAKAVANWVLNDLQRELSAAQIELSNSPVKPAALAQLIELVETKKISGNSGREVLVEMFKSGKSAEAIVAEKGLAQVSDDGALEKWCAEAIAASPKIVADYRGGKTAALQALKGQVMKLSRGKANAARVDELLRKQLGNG